MSRVTTQKFMLTPRGIFELKYFFGSHVTTETGGACSATAIRALIKQLVARGGLAQTALRQPDLRDPRQAGHRGRAPHHRQIPGIFADPSCQSEKVHLILTQDPTQSQEEASMNLQLTGHQLDITPAIRDLRDLEARAHHAPLRPRDRRERDPVGAASSSRRSKPTCTSRGRDIFCESCEPDMYAAIDSLVDKLDRQIIKHKEKVIEHRQNGAARNRAGRVGGGGRARPAGHAASVDATAPVPRDG